MDNYTQKNETNLFKSGYVSIIGKPNVGKSSLLNAILKIKVSIVSPKPQTTRNNITGIYNDSDSQIIFIDTPGIFSPNTRLDTYMQKSVREARASADVLIVVLDGLKPITNTDVSFIEGLEGFCDNIIIVVNKTDATKMHLLYPQLNKLNGLSFVKDIIPTSAKNGFNTDVLVAKIKEYLPFGDKFYEDDYYTDKTEKFMVAEIIREKCLWSLQEEVPHGVAIEVINFVEKENLVLISADIIAERKTHKQIIIGDKGIKIKDIGTSARLEIEKLLNKKVHLTLFVKIKEDWRNKQNYVTDFGYSSDDF